MDTLVIPREILGHPVASRHNIHKSHTHRENTFKRSGVVTSTVTETREPPPHIGKISKLTSLGYLTKKAQLNIFSLFLYQLWKHRQDNKDIVCIPCNSTKKKKKTFLFYIFLWGGGTRAPLLARPRHGAGVISTCR